MKVIINKCSNPHFWYNDMIGREIEVEEPKESDTILKVVGMDKWIALDEVTPVNTLPIDVNHEINWDNVKDVEDIKLILQSFGITIPSNNPMFENLSKKGLLVKRLK